VLTETGHQGGVLVLASRRTVRVSCHVCVSSFLLEMAPSVPRLACVAAKAAGGQPFAPSHRKPSNAKELSGQGSRCEAQAQSSSARDLLVGPGRGGPAARCSFLPRGHR
jgi:hypothetical protein